MIPIIARRTGYKEDDQVLRKKYGLPDDWKPEEPPVRKWRRSDFVNQDNHVR
jgi:hypothetical protein